MRLSARSRESENCAARSVMLKRGGGNALVGEQGETEREVSRVSVSKVGDAKVGEGEESKVKFSENILISCVSKSDLEVRVLSCFVVGVARLL